MAREIRWHIGRFVPIERIREFESRWNIKFPEAYVNIITQHDGALAKVKNDNNEWETGEIEIPRWHGKRSVLALLRYMNTDTVERTAIFAAYYSFKECLPAPDKIFPFADNGGGDMFFFDYRQNESEPAIVFLAHEEVVLEDEIAEEDLAKKTAIEWMDDSLYRVCNSFSELLDLIKLP
ncbi:SMI1/KNR4 family protein [Paenibacillus plantarum]|nr:SMI1/KNR4 family protein [Paenibacillus plantarum]